MDGRFRGGGGVSGEFYVYCIVDCIYVLFCWLIFIIVNFCYVEVVVKFYI